MFLLQDDNQKHQNTDQDQDDGQLRIVPRLAGNPAQAFARPVERALVPVDVLVDLVEHLDVIVQLVSNLDAQLSLPADTVAQPIELLVLISEYVLVILVDLLVVQLALIRGPLLGLVPIRKQRGSVGIVLFIWRGGIGCGARVVSKADGFGGIGGVGVGTFEKGRGGGIPRPSIFGACKVRRQSWIVGL